MQLNDPQINVVNTNPTYPMRAFVRHKAQIQIQQQGVIVDAALLQDEG